MQHHKVNMTQNQFRIGDLANELKVKKFVVRFWEQEFDLESGRSAGGHRFYTAKDLRIFQLIKDLLYKQGYTIEGARKRLPELLLAEASQEEAAQPAIEAVGEEIHGAHQAEIEHVEVAAVEEHIQVVNHEHVVAAIPTPCQTCEKHAHQLSHIKNQLLELKQLVQRV